MIGIVLLIINIIIGQKEANKTKVSPYECGLIPKGEARHGINIQYILIAILFIVFDIEIVVLFPYAMTINNIYAYWIMVIFIGVLAVGFNYEIKIGALRYKVGR